MIFFVPLRCVYPAIFFYLLIFYFIIIYRVESLVCAGEAFMVYDDLTRHYNRLIYVS